MDELHETATAPQFLSALLNLLFSVYFCVLSGNIEELLEEESILA
jgi:hypothetical protein